MSVKIKYLLFGVGFGLIFPILGILIELSQRDLSFEIESILYIHQVDKVIFVIGLAPFILGLIGYLLGIKQNELEKLTRELSKSNQQKDQNTEVLNDNLVKKNLDIKSISYATAHDLKSTLRGISSLETFLSEETDPLERESLSKKLRSRIDRMDKLLDGLQSYLRVSQQNNDFEDVDMEDFFSKLKAFAERRSINLELSSSPTKIRTDLSKLKIVFKELIVNSMMHAKVEDLKIKIEAINLGAQLTINYYDNGVGIEDAYKDKVFGLYSTLNERDQSEHLGVGLAIVKRVIEDIGGKINLKSGKSLHFEICLPM